jgi:hypothetical protein
VRQCEERSGSFLSFLLRASSLRIAIRFDLSRRELLRGCLQGVSRISGGVGARAEIREALLSRGGGPKVIWCDKGIDHVPPFNTVVILAYHVGKHTGGRRLKRFVRRLTIARLCDACLMEAEFSVSGRTLFRPSTTDPASD